MGSKVTVTVAPPWRIDHPNIFRWYEDPETPGLMVPAETYAAVEFTDEEIELARETFKRKVTSERFFIPNDGGALFGLTSQQKMFARFIGALQNPAIVASPETKLQEVYTQMDGDDVWALIKNEFPLTPKFVNQIAEDYFNYNANDPKRYYPQDFPYALAASHYITSEVATVLVSKPSTQIAEILVRNPKVSDEIRVMASLAHPTANR